MFLLSANEHITTRHYCFLRQLATLSLSLSLSFGIICASLDSSQLAVRSEYIATMTK